MHLIIVRRSFKVIVTVCFLDAVIIASSYIAIKNKQTRTVKIKKINGRRDLTYIKSKETSLTC